MKDFSIEYASTNINSKKTKEYFKEVASSYFNENYRAAVVTLYSVVINDIIIKLEVLNEIYSDPVAQSILEETKEFQRINPNNPEWEKEIIDKVKNRTNLFDNADYAHIQALKNDRHLCAHPVIDKEDKLYTPNKETVAAHIRNMLESLFLKPPILSKKILSTILIDIASKKDLLIDDTSLEKYVNSKYLTNLNSTIEISIFRDLWKFVYRLNDISCSENRLINYRLLYFLYKRNISSCIQRIQNEQEYFSNVFDSKETISLLIRFFSENEFLFQYFREDVHLLVSKQIVNNINAKTVAWFLSKSFVTHLEEIKELILTNFNRSNPPFDVDITVYERLINIGITKGHINEISEFVIWRYAKSKNYNDADKVFAFILEPNLKHLTVAQLDKLCSEISNNNQVYHRNQSIEDHKTLRNYIRSKTSNKFDFEKYPRIFNQNTL
ncbi:hypothetical protein GVN20_29015 [Runella sp. CRIBMP]|uniref:hypothetical protein n=1 Tax=Runella sp. CRIBMP TaxID=2683261 RepID=UPI001411D82A|nr:hypothetical protein [Runella sp. CRIBMP]NBB23427.1 hypothetical protein [Runella sp. CRIBMP]